MFFVQHIDYLCKSSIKYKNKVITEIFLANTFPFFDNDFMVFCMIKQKLKHLIAECYKITEKEEYDHDKYGYF